MFAENFTAGWCCDQFVVALACEDFREKAPSGQHLLDCGATDDAVLDHVLTGGGLNGLYLDHVDGAVLVGPLESDKIGTERIIAEMHPAARIVAVEADEQSSFWRCILAIPTGSDQRGEKSLDAALVGLAGVVWLDVQQARVE